MKKTHVLLAVLVLVVGILASPGATVSEAYETSAVPFRDLEIKWGNLITIEEETPGPFDTMAPPITGKITSYSATISTYACQEGTVQLILKFEPTKLEPVEKSSTEGGTGGTAVQPLKTMKRESGILLLRGLPVKLTVAGKTILVPGLEAGRLNAMLAAIQAARLTNKDATFQVAAVPGCENTYYAADVTIN